MKLYNLSPHDACPCVVLKFKTCTIMLDCAIDFSSVSNFLPLTLIDSPKLLKLPSWKLTDEHGKLVTDMELKECSGRVLVNSTPEFSLPETDLLDLSTVDAILISNATSMLGLPYITEYFGFQGTVYATEPTLQIGRLLMEELVEYCHRVAKLDAASKWKERRYKKLLPSSLAHCWENDLLSWRQCYSAEDLHSSLSKAHVVGYAEKVSIFGALNVTAYSSGYSLGSCNWLISSDFEKVVYLSSSSSLTTHPQQLDSKPLSDSDLLIFTGLTQAPTYNPDSMLAEFCTCLAKTVKGGGNVLIPCLPSGLVYDLLECLLSYMEQSNLINIPIYLISPSAKASLASSQIYSEWLHPNKQNKAYLPEPPFPHDELIQLGRLNVYPSISDGVSNNFKKPCIVFAGHPSLRFGDAVHFLELWAKSAANSVIFVEPNFSHLDALAPFQPITARVFHFPIDTRSNHQVASRLLDSLRPRKLVVPASYTKTPATAPHRTDLKLSPECPVSVLEKNSVMNLNIKRMKEKVHLDPELAASLLPSEVKPGVMIAPISAQVLTRNNNHVLKPIVKRVATGRKRKFHDEVVHRPLLSGKVDVTSFVENLKQEGFADVKVEDGPSGQIVLLQDTVIQIDDTSTHIVCEGTETLRAKLRDILIKNLAQRDEVETRPTTKRANVSDTSAVLGMRAKLVSVQSSLSTSK